MVSRIITRCVCLFTVLASACSSQMQRLPVTTPRYIPETETAISTISAPTATADTTPAPLPIDVISPTNLKQLRSLHQYWLAVATGASVDPYEMDISAVAASPDGRLLAVGGCSKPLGEDLRSGNVYCNGQNAQNPGGIPFILILDVNTESVLGTVPENEAGTTIADLAFTPDGEKLIYAIHPGKFVLWDVASSQVESILWEGETSAPSLAISPDGKWIALKSTDQVHIWDPVRQEFVTEIPAYFRPQFSADSGRISVYREKEFIIYETSTWTELLRFGMPCDCVYALSPNLSLLATSEPAPAESTFITVWDTSTGVQIQSLQVDSGQTAFLAFTPDGNMLWRADERGKLTAWDTRDWNFLAENIGGITPIFNLHGFQFVGNGRYYLLFSDLLLGLYGLP